MHSAVNYIDLVKHPFHPYCSIKCIAERRGGGKDRLSGLSRNGKSEGGKGGTGETSEKERQRQKIRAKEKYQWSWVGNRKPGKANRMKKNDFENDVVFSSTHH